MVRGRSASILVMVTLLRQLLQSRWLHLLDRLLTTDFCPWANRYVHWLKQPIGWFVCAAGMSLAVGWFLGPQGFVLFAALAAVIVLGVAWPWIGIRAVRCELSFEQRRAREGDAVRVKLRVHNRLPWPIWGLAVERGFFVDAADADEHVSAMALAQVPGWAVSEFTWDFRPECRAVYPTEPPVLANGFPFGIWHARRSLHTNGELLVWPAAMRLSAAPPLSGRKASIAAAWSRHLGDEGDVLGVRPFRMGDSLRHVHWPQTARHDQLIVCERQAAARRQVHVVIDTDPCVHVGRGAEGSLEWSIRVGTGLCEAFHAHCADVELFLGHQQVVFTPGAQGVHRALDMVARWQGDEDDRGAPPLLAAAGLGVRRAVRPAAQRAAAQQTLPVIVTTDAGQAKWYQRLGEHAVARMVVLRLAAFDAADDGVAARDAETGAAGRSVWMVLDDRDHFAAQLRRGWERVCHDGWDAA